MKNDLVDIKNEFKGIKSLTEKLLQQYNNLSTDVKNIKAENMDIRDKIDTLETKIQSLTVGNNNTAGPNAMITEIAAAASQQSAPMSLMCNTPYITHEALFLELDECQRRANNIIIVGISELTEKNIKARQEHDLKEAIKILQMLCVDCPQPIKLMRLGKYNHGKDRQIRACFGSADIVKQVLRSKSKLTGTVRVYADQTPTQRNYLNELSEELPAVKVRVN